MKRGRPSASIDWACLKLTKDAVRYSRPYVSYYIDMHVLLFQTAFVDSSRVWRGMGPSAVDFFHRFLQSPYHYLSVWSSGDSKQQNSCLFVSLYSADEAAVRYARAFLRAFVGERLRAFFGRRSKLIRCDIPQQPSGKATCRALRYCNVKLSVARPAVVDKYKYYLLRKVQHHPLGVLDVY